MPPVWRIAATWMLRCYPRRWRQRYGLEMRVVIAATPPRASDLVDLFRSALSEWDREIARGPFRLLKAVAAAYALLTTGCLAVVVLHDLAIGARWKDLGPGLDRIPDFFGMAAVFLGADLIWNSPVLAGLWLVRRRIPLGAARAVAAMGLSGWALWVLFNLDRHETWQHGTPGLAYWLGFLPFAVLFASAGAIVGGAVVRDERRALLDGESTPPRDPWRRRW
jgi:hypothetical protein